MSRERKVTIRLSDREYAALCEQMRKEGAGPAESGREKVPAAMHGIRKDDSISAFIRGKILSSDSAKELKRIRLILARMETELRQAVLYLKRMPPTQQTAYSDISFTELREVLQALTGMIERMTEDGGNGIKTHQRGEEQESIRAP